MFVDLRKRTEREMGRKRDRAINMEENHRPVVFHTCPDLGIKPTTQLCVMMGNWSQDFSVYRSKGRGSNQPSHTGKGGFSFLNAITEFCKLTFHISKICFYYNLIFINAYCCVQLLIYHSVNFWIHLDFKIKDNWLKVLKYVLLQNHPLNNW